MDARTKWIIGLGIAGTFAYAAALWVQYPENQDTLKDFGVSIGLLEVEEPLSPPARYYVQGGFGSEGNMRIPALPAMAANSCSADGKGVRLVYEAAIIEDARKDELLAHPQVSGNLDKYNALRRGTIAETVEQSWKKEAHMLSTDPVTAPADPAGALRGLDLSQEENADALQNWLDSVAEELLIGEGLKVSIKVNTVTGLAVSQTCNARMPAPSN